MEAPFYIYAGNLAMGKDPHSDLIAQDLHLIPAAYMRSFSIQHNDMQRL